MHLQMSFVDCSCKKRLVVDSGSKRKLHIIALFGLPQADVLRGHAKNVTFGIYDTRPGTAGADVDSNVILHVWVQLVVRIGGQLARLLPGWLSKWKGRHVCRGGPWFDGPAGSAESFPREPIGLVSRCLAMAQGKEARGGEVYARLELGRLKLEARSEESEPIGSLVWAMDPQRI